MLFRSFAKLNLDLRVLHKRPDGYHEIRTIFQTISLHDTIAFHAEIAKRTQIDVESTIEIPDNLVVRSVNLVLEHLKVRARVRSVMTKRIPMGAGLGGGSSNAAAVLLAIPALLGKHIPAPELIGLAESLGSDVPFFLYGGTALGLGRGTELYPLPDLPPLPAVVVATGIHVSTAEAYRGLNRPADASLTSEMRSLILKKFQTITWDLDHSGLDQLPLQNDFEGAVFAAHPALAATVRKLRRLGARPALMTGSGSAVFGVFGSAAEAKSAVAGFPAGVAHAIRFVSRRRYAQAWRVSLLKRSPGPRVTA